MFAPSQRASKYTQTAQQYSYNDASICLRIVTLLHPLLPNAHSDNIVFLAAHICNTLTRMKRNEQLGSKGIQSTEDVFLGVGHEGKECYMGLLVHAPGAEAVRVFFEGDRMEIRKRDGMSPAIAMEELQKRLVRKLMRVFEEIGSVKLAQGRW